MTKNVDYFKKVFEKQMKENARVRHGNVPYGSNVLPILELYNNLSSYEEKISFQEALTDLLVDSNPKKRKFAVAICTGFIDFRKVI
jgi:hypothetical protein